MRKTSRLAIFAGVVAGLSVVAAMATHFSKEVTLSDRVVMREARDDLGLVCAEPVWDFGLSLKGTDVSGVFVLENRGHSLIQIAQVKPSCGCTVARLESRRLKPGQHGKLHFSVHLDHAGRKNSRIVVKSLAGSTIVLTMKGLVADHIYSDSIDESWDLGAIPVGHEVTRYFDLKNTNGITSVQVVPPIFNTSLRVISGRYLCLSMKPVKGVAPGPFEFRMCLQTTKEACVSVYGTFETDLVVYPRRLHLEEERSDFYVTVSSRSRTKFRLHPKSVPEGIKVIPTGKTAQETQRVRVVISPRAEKNSKIALSSDNPDRFVILPVQ